MAFVFYANSGTLYTFDVEVALESVSKLKEEIFEKINVGIANQVLLVNGGQLLNSANKICFYNGCGTVESNPIYLFNKSIMEMPNPPSIKPYASNIRWTEAIESALSLPNSIKTVAVRTDLALQLSREDDRMIEELKILVRDQQLQYAAWKAVFTNLGSVADSLRKRLNAFSNNCNDYVSKREKYLTTLDRLDHVLPLLKYVPVIPRLLSSSDNELESTEMSLFDWIITQDAGSNLNSMIEDCSRALKHLNDAFYKDLIGEMCAVADAVNNADMIEVKGIENRFNDLSQLVSSGQEIAQNQTEMAQGFAQNNDRISSLKDSSVLSDLWQGHTEQLKLMHANHKKLNDIYQRCFRSKTELSNNLHGRLRWLIVMERSICECDSKLVIHHQTLKHLRHRLSILEQIRSSPEVYLRLLSETVHRWEFSVNVMHWASKVYEKSQKELQEEITRRKQFADWIGKHFLLRLFPGLSEYPITYSHQPPKTINTTLPSISRDDLQRLYYELNSNALSELSLKKMADDLLVKPCNFSCSGKLSPTSKSNRFEFIAMDETVVPTNKAFNNNSPRLFSDDPDDSEPFIFSSNTDSINHTLLRNGKDKNQSPNIDDTITSPRMPDGLESKDYDSKVIANRMFKQWKESYLATVKSELNDILNEVKKSKRDIDDYITDTNEKLNVVLASFNEQQSQIVADRSDCSPDDVCNIDNASNEDTIKLTTLLKAVDDIMLDSDIMRDISIITSDGNDIDNKIDNIVQVIKYSKEQKLESAKIKEELAAVKATREPLAIIEMQEKLIVKEKECDSLKEQITMLSSYQALHELDSKVFTKNTDSMTLTSLSRSIGNAFVTLSECKRSCSSFINNGNADDITSLATILDKVESQVMTISQELNEVVKELRKSNENEIPNLDDDSKSPSALSELDALTAENNYLKEKLNERFNSSSSTTNLSYVKNVAYCDFNLNDYIIVILNKITQSCEICTPRQKFYLMHPTCQGYFKHFIAGVGNTGPQWVLAQIEKMEHCQAKKDINRFNVAKDEMFCLIYAKPCSLLRN
ncbi:uncharacterized protein TRIADDRAFT_56455 [Trichoplax adhaerens]|uniref:Uncharacterized protein n=1 Tax=Trichoplax adhaerens TaxID=10228 RepID=B3RY68_TRIAD|nr:hypothetical protein TRIADDRAFT_56455 [Trichoplax adhaerens]EDV24982.1 hypothetical protein TRIADDRAFT_56455 [Trichoplax adhaerens]|eukprot:XP_002112872.1 hypothetical protein TRIADDRAFT_56455 [Trichoplax adhaerens]